jgi:hypothetical protein
VDKLWGRIRGDFRPIGRGAIEAVGTLRGSSAVRLTQRASVVPSGMRLDGRLKAPGRSRSGPTKIRKGAEQTLDGFGSLGTVRTPNMKATSLPDLPSGMRPAWAVGSPVSPE